MEGTRFFQNKPSAETVVAAKMEGKVMAEPTMSIQQNSSGGNTLRFPYNPEEDTLVRVIEASTPIVRTVSVSLLVALFMLAATVVTMFRIYMASAGP